MRVHAPAANLFAYPDFSVVCGEPQLLDTQRDTLLNPVLIAQVLSPSTESYDRTVKFDAYSSIASLRQYVLVASNRVSVDVFTRNGGLWTLSRATDFDDIIELQSICASFSVRELYDGIKLDDAPRGR